MTTYVLISVDGGSIDTVEIVGPAQIEYIEFNWDTLADDETTVRDKLSEVQQAIQAVEPGTDTKPLIDAAQRLEEILTEIEDEKEAEDYEEDQDDFEDSEEEEEEDEEDEDSE
jgi:hypothetical protein